MNPEVILSGAKDLANVREGRILRCAQDHGSCAPDDGSCAQDDCGVT